MGRPTSELLQTRIFIRDKIGLTRESEETFDVVFGLEKKAHYTALASRYYGLYNNQASVAIMAIGRYTGWRLTNNCSSWATDKIAEIFGQRLASTELFGATNTPRALASTLTKLEAAEPTSISKPKYSR